MLFKKLKPFSLCGVLHKTFRLMFMLYREREKAYIYPEDLVYLYPAAECSVIFLANISEISCLSPLKTQLLAKRKRTHISSFSLNLLDVNLQSSSSDRPSCNGQIHQCISSTPPYYRELNNRKAFL